MASQMDDLPVQPGSYAVILKLADWYELEVGRLGRFKIPPGIYVYHGSACGPGGLRARLGRHLSVVNRVYWHIDYLRCVGEVLGYVYWVTCQPNRTSIPEECEKSQILSALPGASVPSPKFGASDCKSGCPAHLIHFPTLDFLNIPKVYPSDKFIVRLPSSLDGK
jgi:Uri superfamily endonuclease